MTDDPHPPTQGTRGMRGLEQLREMLAKAESPSREIDVLAHAVLGYDTPRNSIYFPDGTLQHWWTFAGKEVVSHITDHLHYIRSFADPKHQVPTYTASLDAAVALVARALPRWRWMLQHYSHGTMAMVFKAGESCGDEYSGGSAMKKSPALALIAALFAASLTSPGE